MRGIPERPDEPPTPGLPEDVKKELVAARETLDDIFEKDWAKRAMTTWQAIRVATELAAVNLASGQGREKLGQNIELAGYTFTFNGVKDVPGPNYMATRAEVVVREDGKKILTLHPENRQYMTMPMTEASISSTLFRDLYVTLDKPRGDSWILEFRYRPFQSWIWWSVIIIGMQDIPWEE